MTSDMKLSIAEVENEIISAIEMTDTTLDNSQGEQSSVWDKVYAALTTLRELAISRSET